MIWIRTTKTKRKLDKDTLEPFIFINVEIFSMNNEEILLVSSLKLIENVSKTRIILIHQTEVIHWNKKKTKHCIFIVNECMYKVES